MSKNYKNYRKLKDTVLLRFLDEIDLEDEDSLNLVLLKHLLNGELDDVYSNKYICNLGESEKKELLNKSRNYIYLLFNSGDYKKYDESIDCPIDDKDFMLYRLLDNYDFLIRLVVNNREILEELNKYKDSFDFNSFSVIETVRNSFNNDEILISSISKFIEEEKIYKLFDNDQRNVLYEYPNGVMYGLIDGNYKPYSSLEIATNIYNYVSDDDVTIEEVNDNPNLISQLSKFIHGNYFDFKNIVIDMCDEFYKVVD